MLKVDVDMISAYTVPRRSSGYDGGRAKEGLYYV